MLDCRFYLGDAGRGREEFRQGHIPRSHYIDLEQELCDPLGPLLGRHPLPSTTLVVNLLSRLGLGRSTHVVVYDDGPGLMANGGAKSCDIELDETLGDYIEADVCLFADESNANLYNVSVEDVNVCGYLRAMNLLMASKRVVVVGYGWVGRGVASRCNGMGSKVIVTEVDPVKALEAHMDGFEVMPMAQAAKIGDMFITCTGMTSVIRKEHILKMKDGAIMGNVGHFDVEIDADFLLKKSKSVKEVRPTLDECTLKNGRKVYLIGQGRLANLVSAEGHPPEVMAQSFSNQLLSVLYILKNHKKMENKIIDVPKEIDIQIAFDALKSMDVKIDKLTPEQVKYANNW